MRRAIPLMVGAFALLVLPPAAAEVSVAAPEGLEPALPGTPVSWTLTVVVDCPDLVPASAAAEVTIIVVVRVPLPEHILIDGPERIPAPLDACDLESGTATFDVDYTVTLGHGLPGLKQFRIDVEVGLEGAQDECPGPLPCSEHQEASVIVSALYAGEFAVVAPQGTIEVSGPEDVIPIHVANHANARTEFRFHVVEGPDWPMATPDPVILASPTNPVTKTELDVAFYLQPQDRGRERVVLRVEAFAADDPDLALDSLDIELHLDARGFLGIPPVPNGVVVLGLLGAALVARRRL